MAALTQRPLQSVPKTAAQMARTIAVNAKNEMTRVSETAQAQILSTEVSQKAPESAPPQVVQEIKNEGVDQVDRQALATWEQSRIKQLEDSIAQMHARNQQQLTQYREKAAQEMNTQVAPQQETVGVMGKVRKAAGQVKQKVQTLLTSRKQSESKSGSGKG